MRWLIAYAVLAVGTTAAYVAALVAGWETPPGAGQIASQSAFLAGPAVLLVPAWLMFRRASRGIDYPGLARWLLVASTVISSLLYLLALPCVLHELTRDPPAASKFGLMVALILQLPNVLLGFVGFLAAIAVFAEYLDEPATPLDDGR